MLVGNALNFTHELSFFFLFLSIHRAQQPVARAASSFNAFATATFLFGCVLLFNQLFENNVAFDNIPLQFI